MPYTQAEIPWAPGSHTSFKAAESVRPGREKKLDRLRALYQAGSWSDHEAAAKLGLPLSSICSLRNALRLELVQDGTTESPFGRQVARWRWA